MVVEHGVTAPVRSSCVDQLSSYDETAEEEEDGMKIEIAVSYTTTQYDKYVPLLVYDILCIYTCPVYCMVLNIIVVYCVLYGT